MSDEIKMSRSKATRLIDDVREWLAAGKTAKEIELLIERQYRLTPLVQCGGEAHSNPFIDNCGTCMPRWGWTGAKVKVT